MCSSFLLCFWISVLIKPMSFRKIKYWKISVWKGGPQCNPLLKARLVSDLEQLVQGLVQASCENASGQILRSPWQAAQAPSLRRTFFL